MRRDSFHFFTLIFLVISTSLLSAQTLEQNRIQVAQQLERRGEYGSALRIFQSLYDEAPRNHIYYDGVKRNLLRLNRFEEALAIIQKQVDLTQNLRYEVDLGEAYFQKGEENRALEIWNDLLNRYPDQRAIYSYVASAMIVNRLYDEAIKVYQRARQHFGQESLYVFELANAYVMRLKYKEATREFLRHLERNPTQFNHIEGRIASYTKERDHALEVAEVLRNNLNSHGQPYLIRKLLANLYLRSEDYGKALQEYKILEEAKAPNTPNLDTSGRELFYFAENAARAGEFEYARQAYELIVQNYPSSPFRTRALYGLAAAKQKQELYAEALQSYKQYVETESNTALLQNAYFQIGEIHFARFEIDQALDAYQTIVRKYPGAANVFQSYFRIGDCHAARGNLNQARTWYERGLGIAGKHDPAIRSQALYKIAYLDFLKGDYEPALESLNKITENMTQANADQTFVNDALELTFLISENQKQSQEALGLYAEAQKLKLQHNYAAAIQKLQEVLTDYPKSGIVDDSLLDLGELENSRGNYAAAIDYLQSLVADHPESVLADLAQKRTAEIYEDGLGELQKAYTTYEKILVDYPHSIYHEEVRQRMRELRAREMP